MGSARSTSTSAGRRPRREQEVLDAAAGVFHTRGYSDATVQDVANELGILKGSLYYYIKTKEDLLFRLIEQVHDEVDELLTQIASDTEGQPPLDRLHEYVRRQTLHTVSDHARLSVYYHDIAHRSPERPRAGLTRREPHEAFVTGLIREAQTAGVAKTEEARL